MSDYATRLTQLAERRQKLILEENRLLERRKKEIGSLAERFQLLMVPDELLAGLFQDAQNTIEEKNSEKVEHWEHLGRGLLQGKFSKSKKNSETENP